MNAIFMIFDTLGPYHIKRKIGQGGMGVVYEGEDRRLLRRVAIKLIPARKDRSNIEPLQSMQEARIASAINHPNICTIYDVGKVRGWNYIVMEYVDGETLQQILRRRGRFTELETVEIGIQVCNALAAAHQKGIIHRDIKPENIMITANHQVKIMDFGLAKLLEEPVASTMGTSQPKTSHHIEQASTSGIEGTVLYMAPEQIEQRGIDARTDVYALGAVLFEMLTGVPPFREQNLLSLITAILETPPPSPVVLCSSLSPAIGQIVCKAL
ncbi:MAG: serine/threonine-protein kinase, partial [candidate division KSB1 bacterium]|nr:serine/threonine-protein kinase [candidate division KSB1 bacterium]